MLARAPAAAKPFPGTGARDSELPALFGAGAEAGAGAGAGAGSGAGAGACMEGIAGVGSDTSGSGSIMLNGRDGRSEADDPELGRR